MTCKVFTARITYSARQLLSFNFQHGAHVIRDLALACIQQAGILRGSTNHIVTPSSIQVHVTESCLRRSPRRLNHANSANCINLSPMADYANNPTRFRCSPETHHSRQSIVTLLSRNSATKPSASFIRRGEDRSKRCHLSIPLSRHVEKKGYDLPSFYLANARSLEKKFDELTAQLLSTRMDIAVITESWFNDRIDDSVLTIPGYVLQRRDRPTRGGGVCTFVSSSIPFKRRSDLESPDHECMWLWLRPPRLPRPLSGIIVGAMYFPEAPADLRRTRASYIIECIDSGSTFG